MHIPDGFVSAQVAVAGAVVAAAGLGVCARRAGRELTEQALPVAGLLAAFFLVLEAPVIPIAVGTSGHLLGGTLAVALLGPWLGPVVITVVTVVQTLFVGAGGFSVLGVNLVNLALVPAAVGYPVLLGLRALLTRRSSWAATGTAAAAGVAATVSVLAAAVLFTAEYAVGGAVHVVPLGAVAASTLGVYSLVALFEGLITGLVVRGLLALRSDLVRVAPRPRPTQAPGPAQTPETPR